jgi:TfoX/Sxy family transcriptional regulator of competence genes
MAFDESLGDRIRELFASYKNVEEKRMFGGLCFMLNDKMCVGIVKDELMLRISPQDYETVIHIEGCREMDFNKKPMKGYVYVSQEVLKTKKDLQKWVNMAISFNAVAKSSKTKKKNEN